MFLRTTCTAICLTALALTSCAATGTLPGVALDFFASAPDENPWSRKIENWQARHHLDPLAVDSPLLEELDQVFAQPRLEELGTTDIPPHRVDAWDRDQVLEQFERVDGHGASTGWLN